MALGNNASVGAFGTAGVTAAGIVSALADAGDAADVAGALAPLTVDPLDGTGWTETTVGGAAAATWETGPARLLLTNPAAATGDEAYAANASFLPEADSYDAVVCFRVLVGTSADTWLSLRTGRSLTNAVHFDVRGNGAIDIYRNVGGVPGSAIASVSAGSSLAPSTAQLASGEFYARIARRPDGVSFSWATSSSGLPTAWTTVHNATDAGTLNVSNGRRLHINTYAAASVVGGFNATATNIRATGRGVGPL